MPRERQLVYESKVLLVLELAEAGAKKKAIFYSYCFTKPDLSWRAANGIHFVEECMIMLWK
jgi:hypothetical protein